MLSFVPRPWPATAWDDLPSGPFRWLTFTRGPTSFIWVRKVSDGRQFRAYLGRPLPLNPGERYQVLNRGYASDGTIAVGGVTTTIEAVALASAVDTGDPNRSIGGESCVCLSKSDPILGGWMRARFRCVFVASASAVPFRVTTEGLKRAAVKVYNAGPDSASVYVDAMPADAPLVYAPAGGHFLSLAIACASGAAVFVAAGGEVYGLGTSTNVSVASPVPLGEQLSALIAVTVTGGATLWAEVTGEVAP